MEVRLFMEDTEIVALYWERSETAILKTASKYGKYCHYIAHNILYNAEDSEECVNDTYMRAWNSLPPHSPECLSAFLGKITRNLSLNMFEKRMASKRGGGQIFLVLDELEECLPSSSNTENIVNNMVIVEVLNRFLERLPTETRKIFVRRYWYLSSIKEIAADYSLGESKAKMLLLRARNQLKQLLEEEGIDL